MNSRSDRPVGIVVADNDHCVTVVRPAVLDAVEDSRMVVLEPCRYIDGKITGLPLYICPFDIVLVLALHAPEALDAEAV